MDYSAFIIMLARQRSGTHALKSILGTLPDVFCLGEVFSLKGRESADHKLREMSFFNFLVQYANGDVTRIFPDQHEKLFRDYLLFLRGFSDKRFILIDVKYNQMYFLTQPYARPEPCLFQLIRKYGLHVLHLTRRNYLRCWLSQLKARRSGVWLCRSNQPLEYADRPISVDVSGLMEQLRFFKDFDRLVSSHFHDYPKFLTGDYAQVFSETPVQGGLHGVGAHSRPNADANLPPASAAPRRGSERFNASLPTGSGNGSYAPQCTLAQAREPNPVHSQAIVASLAGSEKAGVASLSFLGQFSDWLGIGHEYRKSTTFKKQSSLPLCETIENYSEVVVALKGTEFEYCLEDEPMYARPACTVT